MHDKITFQLDGRELKTDGRLYSGEAVTIDIHGIRGTLAASDYKLVIYGRDKAVLAVSGPFAADTASGDWTALINTATEAMSDYFAAVKADAVKTLGLVVVNTDTADTIAHGILDVISVPFADELTPVPQILTYVTHAELTAVLADYATHAELQTVADATETAQDTATSALTEATSAWDTAVAAESAAETAQQTAETAQQTADEAVAGLAAKADKADLDDYLPLSGGTVNGVFLGDMLQQGWFGTPGVGTMFMGGSSNEYSWRITLGPFGLAYLKYGDLDITEDKELAVKGDLAEKADALHTHVAADIADGTLNPARLPIASASALGGIKVGDGLAVAADGTLSTTGGGGGESGHCFIFNGSNLEKAARLTLYFGDGTTETFSRDSSKKLIIYKNNVTAFKLTDTVYISGSLSPNNGQAGFSTVNIDGKDYIMAGKYNGMQYHFSQSELQYSGTWYLITDMTINWGGDS